MKWLKLNLSICVLCLLISCSVDNSNGPAPDAEDPVLSISDSTFDFGEIQEGMVLNITNPGGGTLEWDIITNDDWIECRPNAGVTSEETDEVNVSVDRTGLYPADYTSEITFNSDAGDSINVSVSMTVPMYDPVLSVSDTSLDFGEEQERMTFRIANSGAGTLAWNITTDVDWLECTPITGLTNEEIDTVIVLVDREDLYADDYFGTITIDPNNGDNQHINVEMTIPLPDPAGVWYVENYVLNEDSYLTNATYVAPADGYIQVGLDLYDWPGHYAVEIMIMTYWNYYAFANGSNFTAWHKSVRTEGFRTLTSDTILKGENMRIVIDNSDLGWDTTDYDLMSDDAYFTAAAIFQAH
ncbi:MAG: hypothetical protein P9L92_17440 [Candidatus Electryonea clarkiae]|nr:hypothetical protein [Candidatus Electryonea clarkiae]MDP8287287.1 hypothetical protein [Candidatus Electryonea clarkiae]